VINGKEIPLINKVLAGLLSIILFFVLFLSLYTLPAELVLFNNQSYYQILETPDNIQQMQNVITEIVSKRFNEIEVGYVLPPIFSNPAIIDQISKNLTTEKWIKGELKSITDQVLAFLNFRTPYNKVEVDLTEIKQNALNASDSIAADILSLLPHCKPSDLKQLENNQLSIVDIPACRPPSSLEPEILPVIEWAIEDFAASLPSSFEFVSLFSKQEASGVSQLSINFYYYSISRWVFRLLPIIAILFLSFIAILLKNSRTVMLRWCGRLLFITSVVSLLEIVIVLVGLEQVTSMLLDSLLINISARLGALLLSVAQEVFFQTFVWTAVLNVVVLVFGISLTLIAGTKKTDMQEELSEIGREEKEPESDFEDVLELKKKTLDNSGGENREDS